MWQVFIKKTIIYSTNFTRQKQLYKVTLTSIVAIIMKNNYKHDDTPPELFNCTIIAGIVYFSLSNIWAAPCRRLAAR